MKITKEEIEKHKTTESCWIILDNRVYDVTKFIADHPGGRRILLESAGQDVTREYNVLRHSDEADEMRNLYYIGEFEQK